MLSRALKNEGKGTLTFTHRATELPQLKQQHVC